MARSRRVRPGDLTESWDDVSDSPPVEGIYDEETERDELGAAYRSSRTTAAVTTTRSRPNDSHHEHDTPRRRSLRSSVDPELVMPSSPDGRVHDTQDGRKRDATPRLRLNERSNTSDAGHIRKMSRAATPRARRAERSMTSDAGRFRSSRLNQHDEAEDAFDDEHTPRGSEYPAVVWKSVARPLFAYALDVVGLVLQNLKPLLGWALLVYLLAAGLVFCSGFLNNTINHALTPICRLPFTGALSFCPVGDAPKLQGEAQFGQLVQAQNAFEDILQRSSVGANLPADMKRSEASIRDLKHVVQYSSLPSKNELVFEFGGFVDTARQASEDLSRFNSRIGRAVDHILSTNRWTLTVIDGVTEKETQRGSLAHFFGTHLNIFAPFQPLSLSRDVLLDQYLRHTGAVEEQIMSLIEEAMALRDILDNLDSRLDVIHEVSTRDGIKIGSSKDELFATLWTKLGGNRKDVNKLNSQLGLLRSVGEYRKLAWGHVTATLLKLQEIQHSLEDLRERVALPDTVGTDQVPLEVHIESINLGIERLETQRDANRRAAAQNYDRIVGQAEQRDQKMLGSGKQDREL